jgi:hypothetical protein
LIIYEQIEDFKLPVDVTVYSDGSAFVSWPRKSKCVYTMDPKSETFCNECSALPRAYDTHAHTPALPKVRLCLRHCCYTMRIAIHCRCVCRFACPLDLTPFPFDTQYCMFRVGMSMIRHPFVFHSPSPFYSCIDAL